MTNMISAREKAARWLETTGRWEAFNFEKSDVDSPPTLAIGTVVRAKRLLDPGVADIHPGTIGYVFGETNCYGDEAGPIVQWIELGWPALDQLVPKGGFPAGKLVDVKAAQKMTPTADKVCNIYPGDVEVVRVHDTVNVGHLDHLPDSDELAAIKRLLHYSWKDIAYEHAGLTPEEKEAVSPEVFARLKRWIGAE